jgi:predicted RNA-binding protein with PUA-like domain
MASETKHYLLKTEPSEYSFADLQREGTTVWDGVANPVAVKNLREMPKGAKLVIYHTGAEKQAVGLATVVSAAAGVSANRAGNDPGNDPRNPKVEIKAGRALPKPVTLEQIKKEPLFKDSPLVKIGRLSVVPLTVEQYAFITNS